jgi:murein DD-endopeptidase MepM/ murein hydrolase activator NlpD
LRAFARARQEVLLIDTADDHSYFGAFRKRRTIAIGAATLAFLTVTVHDLPAQAATMKVEAYAAASQTLVVSTPTLAPYAGRDDLYSISQFTPVQWPIAPTSEVSSGFGWRVAPCRGCSSDHQGVDFTPGEGAPIHVIADGVVVASVAEGALGQHVIVQHLINGLMVQSVYGHMIYGSQTVRVGDTVTMGEVLGEVGSTGASTGPHLHFGILPGGGEPVEPLAWMAANVTQQWDS